MELLLPKVPLQVLHGRTEPFTAHQRPRTEELLPVEGHPRPDGMRVLSGQINEIGHEKYLKSRSFSF